MWPFKKKEVKVEEPVSVAEVEIKFKSRVRSWSVPWKEGEPWPEQYTQLADWFYYNTKREVFSFKYKGGVFLFKKEDVKSIEFVVRA